MIDKILETPGFTTTNSLSKDELYLLEEAIYKQWFSVLSKHFGLSDLAIIEGLAMSNYHFLPISDAEHKVLFPKRNRILCIDFVRWFESTKFIRQLRRTLGPFIVSDEEQIGHPNYYWRLTRPGKQADIGPLHKDSWFWSLESSLTNSCINATRIKAWIPIYIETGLNGLLILPNSHKNEEIQWHSEFKDGKLKPVINDPCAVKPLLLPMSTGEAVLFNDNLLHGGALNLGHKCRISIEFTLLFQDNL